MRSSQHSVRRTTPPPLAATSGSSRSAVARRSAYSRGLSGPAAAFAGAVVLGLGLPAQASLIDDTVTVEVAICAGFNTLCIDTVTVVDPTAEITGAQIIPTNTGANFFSQFGGASSFININDSTVDFFFDFDIISQIIFTGLEWQNVAGGLVDGALTFNVTTGMLSNDPLFSSVTASTFTVSVNCLTAQNCTSTTGGVGFTVFLNPVHGVPPGPDPVPEPDTLALFGVGLLGLGLLMLRRRRSMQLKAA